MNQDIDRIVKNLTKDGPDGKRLGKYDVVLKTLPAKPKSSQGASKTEYQKTLIEQLKKSGEDFTKFRNKEILVYICVYLREEKYKTHDVDNFIKAIIDALKPFIGDDSGVVTVIAEKKPIRNYQEEDLDFLEQVFVVVTTPEAKADILA